MENKYFKGAEKKLKEKYQISVINDIFLDWNDRVILFADRSNTDNIELEVISGNLELIGFDDKKSIKLSEILDAFDYNNKYGEIAGKMNYFEENYKQICDFSEPKDISLPIISKDVRKWLRFIISPMAKVKQLSIFTIMDVTKLHTQEEQTYAKTHIDSLTKLFNGYTFDYHYGRKYLLPNFHVMYLDLDDFKEINNTYGHIKGNEYLIAVSNLLKTFQTKNKLFYRIGGDEFVGLLIGTKDEIKKLADTIIKGIRNIKLSDMDIRLTASMGVIKATKSNQVARKADDLMYKVKKTGKNNYLYEIEED